MQISKLMIQQGEVRKQNKCAHSFGSVWLGYTPTPAKTIFLEASQSGLYGLLTFPILCRCVDHFNFAWLAPTVGVLGLKIYFRFSRRALFLKQLQQIQFSTPRLCLHGRCQGQGGCQSVSSSVTKGWVILIGCTKISKGV